MPIYPNLYNLVRVSKSSGAWNLPGGSTSSTIYFANIRAESGYGTSTESVFDKDLRIGSVDTSWGSIWKDPLAKVGDFEFSITNLDLFYHVLVELNGNDPHLFQGEKIELFLCNGFVPAMFWDGVSQWEDVDGTASAVQLPAPSGYVSVDRADRIFTGTIEQPIFSIKRTTFRCAHQAQKRNRAIGTLADPKAQVKDRGGIVPIVYGDWTDENALAPVVLDRTQREVPRVLLGEDKLKSISGLYLFDKESERQFEVVSDYTANADNNQVDFIPSTPLGTLGQTITTSTFRGMSPINMSAYFNGNLGDPKMVLTKVDDELIALPHYLQRLQTWNSSTDSIAFGNRTAGRGWGQTSPAYHSGSSVYRVDENILNLQAKVRVSLRPVGLVAMDEDKEAVSVTYTFPLGVTETTSITDASAGGDLWPVVQNEDGSQSLSSPVEYRARIRRKASATDPIEINTAEINLAPLWERVGISGIITDCDLKISLEWRAEEVASVSCDELADKNKLAIRTMDPETGSVAQEDNYPPGTLPHVENLTYASPSSLFASVIGDFQNLYSQVVRIFWRGKNLNLYGGGPPAYWENRQDYLKLYGFELEAEVLANAEEKLWFAKVLGRNGGGASAAIQVPDLVFADLLKSELDFPGANINTPADRTSWKAAVALHGSRPQWRSVARGLCYEMGMANYQDGEDAEWIIDLDKNPSPDLTITQGMVLLGGENMLAIDYSFTARSEIFSRFELRYQRVTPTKDSGKVIQVDGSGIESTDSVAGALAGSSGAALVARCAAAQERIGLSGTEQNTLIIDSEYIRDLATAELALQHHILWNTSIKTIVKVQGTFEDFGTLELGSQVDIDIAGLPASVTSPRYIVTGKRVKPAIGETNSFGVDLTLTQIPE